MRRRALGVRNTATAGKRKKIGTFVYDGNYRRVKQTIDGETIYSFYSQSGGLLYRFNASDATKTSEYVRLGNKTVARLKGSGPSYVASFPHQDHLGSPVAATDSAGAILWREDFTPYGEKRQNPDGNKDNEGFTGHIDDAASGLTYMQARYYDPVLGRFLSNDPVTFLDTGNPGYFNRYSYTMNDPVNNTDPDGRACVPCVPVAIFLLKEAGSEAVEQTTGVPMPTVKNAGKFAGKKALKTTRSLRGRKSFKDATAKNKANNNGKCEFCNKNEATQGDHIKPLNDFKKDVNAGKMTKADAKDIANKADNNAAACPSCNLSKGTKSLGDGPNDFKPHSPNDRIKDIMKDN